MCVYVCVTSQSAHTSAFFVQREKKNACARALRLAPNVGVTESEAEIGALTMGDDKVLTNGEAMGDDKALVSGLAEDVVLVVLAVVVAAIGVALGGAVGVVVVVMRAEIAGPDAGLEGDEGEERALGGAGVAAKPNGITLNHVNTPRMGSTRHAS
jgi:hypothetical protein